MKKTQRKDLFRNIRRQWVSFLSIALIALLGVAAFLGIDYSVYTLQRNVSDLYNTMNFRDVEIVSTLLLSPDDLDSLRALEGVADVEPLRVVSADALSRDGSESVSVRSLTQRINRVEIVAGRLPAATAECAIEHQLAEDLGLQVGDRFEVSCTDDLTAGYLRETAFCVVGIVLHPDHINITVRETPYVLVNDSAFDIEALDGCYMRAEVAIDKAKHVSRLSDGYQKTVAGVMERIGTLAVSRTALRDAEVLGAAEEQINSAREQLVNGFDQLEQAKESVRDRLRNLVEIVVRQESEKKLIRWATVQTADPDDPGQTARYFWITENIRVDLGRSVEDIFRSIVSSENVSEKLLVSAYEYLQDAAAPLKENGSDYDLDAIRAALVARATAFTNEFRPLAEGCNTWDEGHARYLDGLETYRETIASLQPCRWLSFDGNGNASFAQLMTATENFANLKTTFSLMFVFVGALVIFATVGKMIDEQRSLVGTTKALGFFSREIFAKYLFFGVLATSLGILLGIATARFSIEPLLMGGFIPYYRFDFSRPGWRLSTTVIAAVAGVLLASAAVWVTCRRLLREPAVRLMQPKAPGTKKASARKGKRVLSLYSRLILLNMRTDLKRVIVTIVSIAGCCALVVIGVTLRSAVNGSVDKQYGEIVDFDLTVQYDPDGAAEDGKEFRSLLDEEKTAYTNVYTANVTYQIDTLQIADIYCGDPAQIHEYFHLNDWKTGKPISPTDRGILIPRRTAEVYGLDVGSEMELALGGTKTATVRVAGVFENYIGKTIVMSAAYYETAFGEPCPSNAFLIRLDGADAGELTERLRALDGFETVAHADENRAIIETAASSLNSVVWMFIFIAAIMAGVVQMNLTNMYVLQKKRELTIMRINGFSVREVTGYLLRETVLSTALGILFGLAAGAGLAYSIVRTLEQPLLQFRRDVDWIALLLAAALTVLFTVIVNAVALRNVKNLKLTDVA